MRINPPILFWILIGAVLAGDRFLPLYRFAEPWLRWGGALLVVLGLGISIAGKRRFQRIGTNVYTFEEPSTLVTDGIYGVSRNPMYLGLVLAGAGAGLVSGTLTALVLAAAFALIVRYWYIAYEENTMRGRFEERYEAYCQQVGRWFGWRRTAP